MSERIYYHTIPSNPQDYHLRKNCHDSLKKIYKMTGTYLMVMASLHVVVVAVVVGGGGSSSGGGGGGGS